MAKPRLRKSAAPSRQFGNWIHPHLTIPVDDDSFLVNIPAHELHHLGTHNLTAYRELPMFPFPKSQEPANQE